jgi:hypothetical protein
MLLTIWIEVIILMGLQQFCHNIYLHRTSNITSILALPRPLLVDEIDDKKDDDCKMTICLLLVAVVVILVNSK